MDDRFFKLRRTIPCVDTGNNNMFYEEMWMPRSESRATIPALQLNEEELQFVEVLVGHNIGRRNDMQRYSRYKPYAETLYHKVRAALGDLVYEDGAVVRSKDDDTTEVLNAPFKRNDEKKEQAT